MFNRTEHHYHTANSTTVEKRAPTDESVRLLKEFEQAARDKFESSIRLNSNTFKAHIMKSMDILAWDKAFVVLYEVNGKRHRAEIRIMDCKQSPEEIKEELLKQLGEHIAANLLTAAFSELSKMELSSILK